MRTVLIRPTARRQFLGQINYLLEYSPQGAQALSLRFATFLNDFLSYFPETGTYISEKDIWEIVIARTRLIVWYRFDEDELRVLAVWNSAQNRGSRQV